MSRNTASFEARNVEASRVGEEIHLEVETMANVAMIFRMEPHAALDLAHQIERAYHQHRHPPAPKKRE